MAGSVSLILVGGESSIGRFSFYMASVVNGGGEVEGNLYTPFVTVNSRNTSISLPLTYVSVTVQCSEVK